MVGSLNEGGLSIDFIDTEQLLTLPVRGLSAASVGSGFSFSSVCLVGGRSVWSGGA